MIKTIKKIMYALTRLSFILDDRKVFIWLFKSLKFKKAYVHFWCRLNVRDVGGFLGDFFIRKFPSLVRIPKEVEFEITTRCGLRCVMCEHTHWDHTAYAKQDIGLNEVRKIVEPWPELKYVGIQGMGNPFLNKDFKNIIRYLDEKGIFINVVENFCEVKDEDMEVIVKHVNRIDLSLDASYKELYEKIRPGSNFDGVKRNIQKCKDFKVKYNSPFPSFFVRIVAFKDNYHDIKNIIKMVSDMDLNNGGNVVIEISGLLLFDKIKDLIDENTKAPQDVIDECQALANECNNITLIFQRSKDNPSIESCAKWVQPFVMGNGDVVYDCGCMMSDDRLKLHNLSFGNIIENSIKDIWNGETYKKFRMSTNDKSAPVPKPCAECRSFSSKERVDKHGVIDFDVSDVARFHSKKTYDLINVLQQPKRQKKIYIKDMKSYKS